jgi:phage terminase small subunit
MALTKKQEAFALAYVKSTNASEAYRLSYNAKGMSAEAINVEACRLLKNPKVALRVNELTAPAREEAEDAAAVFIRENRRIALFDPRKLFEEDGTLKPIHLLDDDTAAALSAFEVNELREDGKVVGQTKKMKFWDKGSAIEKAFRHLGLFEKDNAQRSESLALQVVLVQPPAH